MQYGFSAIPENAISRAVSPVWQHAVDTYASETNKVYDTWMRFSDADLAFRPHPKSNTVHDILKHELLSERRFFGEFLGMPEPAAGDVMPSQVSVKAFAERLAELARPRLTYLANRDERWWLTPAAFFDVERQRVWIFWRRILHTAHHRTQLTVYLRMLDRPVPAIYGPTADEKWSGADPTASVEAASRGASAPSGTPPVAGTSPQELEKK